MPTPIFAEAAQHGQLDPKLRSVLSLVILLHLLCVAFVYAANNNPSPLQIRLAGVLAPYTQLTHLDPGGAKLALTDGTETSDDHVVIVTPKESSASGEAAEFRFPERERRFSPDRWRVAMLANEMSAHAEQDELIALFAKSFGSRMMLQHNFDHVYVKVLHKTPQPLDRSQMLPGYPMDDPDAAPYFDQVYEGEVWRDDDGEIQVLKRAAGLNAAPTSQGAAGR